MLPHFSCWRPARRLRLLLVYLVVVVQLSDVFQYVWGKLLGKHRFSPNISPSKTIEGLVGGGASAILVGTLLYRLTPFSPLQAAAISTVIVVAGFFGGFVLSAIKRDLNAKDWGYVIEGHGGVLDRLRLHHLRSAAVLPHRPLLVHHVEAGFG